MTSALVLAATGIAWSNVTDLSTGVSKSDAISGDAPKSTDGAVNVLLVGLDSRKDQNGDPLPREILDKLHAGDSDNGGYNTNTLILLHVPNDGSKATAISIPRDDYVDVQGIPQYKKAKIKEAYGLAKYFAEQDLLKRGINDRHSVEQQGREAGRKKAVETVRNFLGGVPIDHFAELNLAGFYDLASALGGVEVCLHYPVNDDWSGANFPAGRQILDGSQSLAFVRQRHGLTNGDLDRTHRQQAFLASAMHKLSDAGTFTDPGKLRKLIDVVKKDVVVDSGLDIFSFARQARAISGGNVEFVTLPIDHYAKDDLGQDVNIVDLPSIRSIVRNLIGEKTPNVPSSTPSVRPPEPTTAVTTVDLRYGPDQAGLAPKLADSLAGLGFGNGEASVVKGSITSGVYYGDASKTEAETVAEALGGLPILADSTVPHNHVVVYLGKDFHPPAATPVTPPAQHGMTTPPHTDVVMPTAGPQGTSINGSGDVPCVD